MYLKCQSLIAFLILCSTCMAQIVVEHDPNLWGNGAINPSGEAAVPIVQYDHANGEMWINTVGLNGVSDTADINTCLLYTSPSPRDS